VTVDEFQDTNGLQMELLQLLVGEPYNVCVVGDDDQSIYGWRGAQVSNILNFDRFFPNPRVVRLEENYRSTQAILSVANKLISHNPSRHDKALRPTIAGGEKVQLMGMPGDDEEAAWVVDEIRRLRDGGFVFGTGTPPAKPRHKWEDFAILFRTNTQIRRMEQAMREAEIPYRLVGAQSFFDRREVRDVLAYLQLGLHPEADVALLRVLNTPPRGIASGTATLLLDYSREMGISVWSAMWEERFLGELSTRAAAAVRKFAGELTELRDAFAAEARKAPRVLRKFLEEAGYIDWLMRNCKTEQEGNQRREAIGELMTALTDALARGETLQHFVDTAALDKEPEDDLETKQGVTLITLHASKGLEFPIVFLVGVEEGILPHQRSLEDGTKDEERRLFYVGITRAQQKLYLTFCGMRKKWGETVLCQPSSFINELDFAWIEETDYEEMMNAEASPDELQDFFGGMRAMLE
jgi:superfamily I DNA/RNA helicase